MSGDPEEDFFQNTAGDGMGDSMDARVTRLETHWEYMRADLAQIKAGQIAMQESIRALTMAMEKIATDAKLSVDPMPSVLAKIQSGGASSESRLNSAMEKITAERTLSRSRRIAQTNELPTKGDLMNYQTQAILICIAIYVLVVTGITGGLILIKNG